jgi:hypothetical protein
MTTINKCDFNISEFKPETIETFRKIYSEKKEFLEYLSKFGNGFEKAAADVVLKIGE